MVERVVSRALCVALIGGFTCLVTAGCGDDDGASAGPRIGGGCSTEQAATCRVTQKACELVGGAPECFGCDAGHVASIDGTCAAIAGTALHHRFADFTSQPGEEITGVCQSWAVGNEEDIYVTAVEMSQNQGSHHSNWMWVRETQFEGPDGIWPCAERDYDQLAAVLGGGGVVYAQSTQATREVQMFPNGAVIRLPPRAKIIANMHILNVTPAPITGHVELTLYTEPAGAGRTVLAPFHLSVHALEIQPRSTTRHEMTCDIAAEFRNYQGRDPRMTLYWALPHTHALGSRVFLQAIGGPRDGEYLIDLPGFDGEARGISYSPPLDLEGTTGFRFGCEWDNPRDEVVRWGFGDQEMCEMLGFMEESVVFESIAREISEVEPDGAIRVFEGNCPTLLVPWESRM